MNRELVLIVVAGALSSCAGGTYDRYDDSALEPPPFGSSIPEPHAGANAGSEMVRGLKAPAPRPEAWPVEKPKGQWASSRF